MKIKNISRFDRYYHKVMPLLALLFFLLVVLIYVLGEPYKVTLFGSQESMRPEDVEDQLLKAASQLEMKITKPENPLPPLKLIPYTEEFQKRARRSLIGKAKLDVPLGQPGLDPKQFPPTPPPPSEYMVHLPPPATSPKVRADFGVLMLPEDSAQAQAWLKLVGNHQPRDIRIVTVSGTFNMAAWRRRLEAPASGESIPIPQQWWRPRLFVADVILERQTLDPLTGEWGPVEVIGLLPNNAYGIFRKWSERYGGGNPTETVQTIRLEQDQITRQAPPPLTSDHPWVPPGADTSLTEEQKKKFAELDSDIRELNDRLNQLSGSSAAGHEASPPHPAPRSSGAPGTSSSHLKSELALTDPAKIKEKIKEKLAERNALLTGKPIAKVEPPKRGVTPTTMPDRPESDKVEVWAHDVTAKPGMTYRYRLEIAVLNPLFQQQGLNAYQRAEFLDRLALTSSADQEENPAFKETWSAPVTIDQELYFFVTGANPASRSVTVEIWRINGGMWRPKEFTVQAGDPIGETASAAGGSVGSGGAGHGDLSINALAVDIDFNAPVPNQPLAQTTTRLIYFDKSTGQLLSRTIVGDRDDPRRARLRNQPSVGSVAEGHGG